MIMGEDVHEQIVGLYNRLVDETIDAFCSEHADPQDWNIKGLEEYLGRLFNIKDLFDEQERKGSIKRQQLIEKIKNLALQKYRQREKEITQTGIEMRELERVVLLRSVDTHWIDHIDNMDQLRQGVRLRAYGQRDPVVEYRLEGFDMFEEMIRGIQEDTIRSIYNLSVKSTPKREQVARESEQPQARQNRPAVSDKKVGRNDPCPCGSGKKYKNCCGKQN